MKRPNRLLVLTIISLLISLAARAQIGQDSSCYSAAENAGITRGLLELSALRKQDSAYAVAIGHYRVREDNVKAILDRYEAKHSFLGIGIRKQKRALRKEILK